MSNIFDSTVGALNTSLNLREMNQNLIASNIANADTPGYKAQSLEFEKELRNALGTSDQLTLTGADARHISPNDTDPVFPVIYDDPNGEASLEGNAQSRRPCGGGQGNPCERECGLS